jgi:hypothetical protein
MMESIRSDLIQPSAPLLTKTSLKFADGVEITAHAVLDNLPVEKKKNFKTVVVTDANNQKASVQVKELAKALYVSESQIVQAADSGKLDSLVAHLAETMQKYKMQFAHFERHQKLVVAGHSESDAGALTARQLMKTTAAAFLNIYPGESEIIDLGRFKGKVLVSVGRDGSVEIFKIMKRLGKGSFGKADLMIDVTSGDTTVMKLARQKPMSHRSQRENAVRDVKNEYITLCIIHQGGNKTGIQDKPRMCVEVLNQSALSKGKLEYEEAGYMGSHYDGTASRLGKDPDFKGAHALDALYQLFSGLDTLTSLEIVHCDLKPANILFRKNPDPTAMRKFEVHLSDFGGACRLHDGAELREFGRGTYTESYTCKEDDKEIESLYNQYKNGEIDEATTKRAVRNVLHRGDCYSVACACFNMLTGKEYSSKISPSQVDAMLQAKEIPSEISKLLRNALDSDFSKRPTPGDFLQAIDALKQTVSA